MVIGYSSGHIDEYNMQSGRFQGSFIDSPDPVPVEKLTFHYESDADILLGTAHHLTALARARATATRTTQGSSTTTSITSTSTIGIGSSASTASAPISDLASDEPQFVSVSGVALDGLNQVLLSVGSLDCTLKLWHFKAHRKIFQMRLEAPASKVHLHRERFFYISFF